MLHQCVIIFIVALAVGPALAAGRWPRAAPADAVVEGSKDPTVVVTEGSSPSPLSEQSEDSGTVMPQQTGDPKSSPSNANRIVLNNQWAEVVSSTSKSLDEALKKYDEAKARYSREMKLLTGNIKFLKLSLDTYFYLYVQRNIEIEKLQNQLARE